MSRWTVSMIVDTPKHQRKFVIDVPPTNTWEEDQEALEIVKKRAYKARIGIPRNALAKLRLDEKIVRFKGGYAQAMTTGID